MSVWKEVGFFMVIFLAGLQNIPSDFSRRPRSTASNGLQVFRHITLPLLAADHALRDRDRHDHGLQVFIPQFVMTQGGPVDATLVLTLDIYQTAFVFLDGGKGAAMSVVLFLIIAVITLVQFWLYRSRAYG